MTAPRCPCCGVPVGARVPLSADVRATPPPRTPPPLDVTRDILLSVEAQVERLRTKARADFTADDFRDVADAIDDLDDAGDSIEDSLIRGAALAVLWACRLRGAR